MQITETPLEIEPQMKRHSTLAFVSLICSLVFCCPVVTILGPILGFISLVKLKRNPNLKGKGFAWTGIIIGAITTIASAAFILFLINVGTFFIEKMSTTIETSISAGYEGDYATFRQGLTITSSTVTDEEIQLFIDELRTRYGKFDSVVLNEGSDTKQLQQTSSDIVLPVRLVFEETDVDAEVILHFVPNPNDPFDITIQMNCIYISDSVHGDIAFPEGVECGTVSEEIEEDPSD